MDLIPEIKKLVEAAEITATEKCIDAKAQWELLIREGHENSYAACVRWDAWREAATMMADLGQAMDELANESEVKVIEERICQKCGKPCYSSCFVFDWECPHCGEKIPGEKDREVKKS
jgi:ribosomal protein L37AE/L43A